MSTNNHDIETFSHSTYRENFSQQIYQPRDFMERKSIGDAMINHVYEFDVYSINNDISLSLKLRAIAISFNSLLTIACKRYIYKELFLSFFA